MPVWYTPLGLIDGSVESIPKLMTRRGSEGLGEENLEGALYLRPLFLLYLLRVRGLVRRLLSLGV